MAAHEALVTLTGDALGRSEHIDLSQGGDDKELAQSDIDHVWSSVEPQLSRCITDDWILVTPEAGPVPRSRILDVIGSGLLSHATMTKVATHACVAGDIAWVTGRGQNTGTFDGKPMAADEYITDIYRKVDGTWRCMLTHLTPVGGLPPDGA